MNANEGIAPKFIILRGLPGSGKSHKAQRMLIKHGAANDGHLFSLNNIEDCEGGAAKRKLLDLMKTAIGNGVSPVIWDADNLTPGSMSNAANFANDAGYEISIEYPDSDWWKEFSPMLHNKKDNEVKLGDFAKILSDKSGGDLESILNAIGKWEPAINIGDMLGNKVMTKTDRKAKSRQPMEKKLANDAALKTMRKIWKAFLDQ